MDLILWTNRPALARSADRAGVPLIGVDLERLGKEERQGHHSGCWISDHEEEDLVAIRSCLTQAKLFVRTNPPHSGLNDEVDRLLELGAQALMMPMFRTAKEAEDFVACIKGRAKVFLQVETVGAADSISDIAAIKGIDGIFVGLNDLTLELGLPNRFDFLFTPLMQTLSDVVRKNSIAFGFGGIGRVDDTSLPIPSDLIFAQYAKFHGVSALIARVFLRQDNPEQYFEKDYTLAMQRIAEWEKATPEEIRTATQQLAQRLSR